MSSAGADKTEKATPKRREEARKEGNVARSMEVNSAFSIFAAFSVLSLWGPSAWSKMSEEFVRSVQESAAHEITSTNIFPIFFHMMWVVAVVCAPFLLTMTIVGVIANVLQVKLQFTPEVIKPRFSKLNPKNGIKRMFSTQSIFELFKNVGKLVIVGAPAAMLLWSHREELVVLGAAEPIVAAATIVKLVMKLGWVVAGIYIVLAVVDYIYQKHVYEKNLKMTKQEVKQEAKQQELAPELKSAQRRRQRDMARRRMLADVPTADVVITNPTHFAVALKYDEVDGAPRVVAKGCDLLAKRIREIATENDVMLVENKPLARALYAQCEIGHFIPADLFSAVAEVLAFVFHAQRTMRAAA